MSSRSFTKEEQAILKENRYTYNVSANTISFTIEFKKEFWKRYQSGERHFAGGSHGKENRSPHYDCSREK